MPLPQPDGRVSAEPVDLAEARALLEKFEAKMRTPEGLGHLSDGLALLADLRTGASSERYAQVASRLAMAYARTAQGAVESLLSREPSIHWEVFDHWRKVFAEFEQSGFTLPQEVADVRSKLWDKTMDKYIKQMSPSERNELLERLKAMGDQ